MKARVGELRQQSALADSNTPVIIISDDEVLNELLAGRCLEVVEFYPDTTDGEGKWRGSFKIKVAFQKSADSISDLHRRDAKRMKSSGRALMKSTPIAKSDVGKIFVVSIAEQTGRIMPSVEFLQLPVDSFDCWEEISEFDVNQ